MVFKINQFTYKSIIAIILFALIPLSAFSLEDPKEDEKEFAFPDEQLIAFFDSNRDISELRRESNAKIEEVVSEQDLTMERFNQIARAAQIGALQGGAFSDDEINAFNVVGPKINQIQRELNLEIQATLEERDLNSALYQEILRAYQQDQELQAHVREILRERAIQAVREERLREAEEKLKEEDENEG